MIDKNDNKKKTWKNPTTRNEKELFELIQKKRIDETNIPGLKKFFKRRLSSRSFNINCYNENGFTPLMIVFAALEPLNEIEEELISEYDESHAKEIITILLENGADINMRITERKGYLGETALHIACSFSTSSMVRFLLEHGANPHIPYATGITPLLVSVRYVKSDIMKVLLEYGVDVNVKTSIGSTPLHGLLRTRQSTKLEMMQRGCHFISDEDAIRCINVLLEYGADVNIQNNDGATPLYLAVSVDWRCSASGYSLVKLLLDANANMNIPVTRACRGCPMSIDGDTPVHIAVKCISDIKLVQLLLEYHPNLGIRNSFSDTVLDTSKRYKEYKITDLIEKEIRHQIYKYLICQWTPLQMPTVLNQIGISTSSPFILKRKMDQL